MRADRPVVNVVLLVLACTAWTGCSLFSDPEVAKGLVLGAGASAAAGGVVGGVTGGAAGVGTGVAKGAAEGTADQLRSTLYGGSSAQSPSTSGTGSTLSGAGNTVTGAVAGGATNSISSVQGAVVPPQGMGVAGDALTTGAQGAVGAVTAPVGNIVSAPGQVLTPASSTASQPAPARGPYPTEAARAEPSWPQRAPDGASSSGQPGSMASYGGGERPDDGWSPIIEGRGSGAAVPSAAPATAQNSAADVGPSEQLPTSNSGWQLIP